jgi:hypothetical protein
MGIATEEVYHNSSSVTLRTLRENEPHYLRTDYIRRVLVISAFVFSGCTTSDRRWLWATGLRVNENRACRHPFRTTCAALQRNRPCLVLGGWFASDDDNYHKMQMAAAQLGADTVIVQGAQPQSQRDYWQYPKTSGIAIKYTD